MNKPTLKTSLRYAAIAISSVGISGAALATTSVSGNSGPGSATVVDQTNTQAASATNTNVVGVDNTNSQQALSGSVANNGNTGGGYGQGGWADTDPVMWQKLGHSFDEWWSSITNDLSGDGASWNGGDDAWMPVADNWQTNWNNWDPATWQKAGGSYKGWSQHLVDYLNANRDTWSKDWHLGSDTLGGMSLSGDATNANAAITDVLLDNGGSGAVLAALVAGGVTPSSITIGGTSGPDSLTSILETNASLFESSNFNSLNLNNFNSQTAVSGDVSSNGNTASGNLTSGAAANTNTAATSVQISN